MVTSQTNLFVNLTQFNELRGLPVGLGIVHVNLDGKTRDILKKLVQKEIGSSKLT